MPRYSYSRPNQYNQAGFTLIEMLVVLIMVVMISAILFQGLELSYRLQDRFGVELFKVQHEQMATDWYRQTVQGLYPDESNGSNIFQGKEKEFSGLSNNPLSAAYGAPTPIIWKIISNQQDGISKLIYIEENRETTVLAWRSNEARFIYFDEKLTPNDSWPPPLGLATQLPKQIQLVIKYPSESSNIVATPMGPIETPIRMQNIFGLAQ